MKTLALIWLLAACPGLHAQTVPVSAFADWKELSEPTLTNRWTFWRVGRPVGDGGSVFYEFAVSGAETVAVVVAHTNYWTKDDIKQARQPFFLFVGQKMHRFDSGTAEEQAVCKTIRLAMDGAPNKTREMLEQLLELIKTRKPLPETTDPKPYPESPAQKVGQMVAKLRKDMTKQEVVAALGQPSAQGRLKNGMDYLIYSFPLGTNVVHHVPSGIKMNVLGGRVSSWSIIYADVEPPTP